MPTTEEVVDRVDPLSWPAWLARGVSFLLAGFVSIRLAVGLACGLAAFAFWEALHVWIAEPDGTLATLDRMGKALGVVFYASLVFSALELAFAPSRRGSAEWSVERLSRIALDQPIGRVAVGVAGLVTVAVALRRASRLATGAFSDDLEIERADANRIPLQVLGRLGEAGRGGSDECLAGRPHRRRLRSLRALLHGVGALPDTERVMGHRSGIKFVDAQGGYGPSCE